MRITKKVLLEEQAARKDAKQRASSQDFDPNVEVREEGNLWQRESHPSSPAYVRPPMQAQWHEETHEMGSMGRPQAHAQEFI